MFLVALLLIVGGIVAFFALRDGDDSEPAGTTGTVPTQTGPAPTTTTETTTTTAETTTTETTTTETTTTAETQTGPDETATMPDVRGDEHDDAAEDVVDAGLLPETFPVDAQEERATVVAQEPGPGTRLVVGSTVRLDVSLGTGEREQLEVPDLVGLDAAQALEECARAGFTCRLGAGAARERPVTSQQPAPGSPAPELTQIRLSQG